MQTDAFYLPCNAVQLESTFLGNLDGTDTELLTDLILQLSVLCVFDDSII